MARYCSAAEIPAFSIPHVAGRGMIQKNRLVTPPILHIAYYISITNSRRPWNRKCVCACGRDHHEHYFSDCLSKADISNWSLPKSWIDFSMCLAPTIFVHELSSKAVCGRNHHEHYFSIACQWPTSLIDRCRSHCKLWSERCHWSTLRTTRVPSRSVSGPAPSGHIGKKHRFR